MIRANTMPGSTSPRCQRPPPQTPPSPFRFPLLFLLVLSLPVTSAAPQFLARLFQQRGGGSGRAPGGQGELVELSHTMAPDTVFWPGFPGFNLTHLLRGKLADGFWIEANWVSFSEHGGTHMDAPAHFAEGGKHLSELPLERFFAPACVIDAMEEADANPDFELQVQDLQEWEQEHGRIPPQSAVLVHFGWNRRWPDKTLYYNTPTPDNTATHHFPGVDVQALRWLVEQRDVKLVGVDVPSIDFGQNKAFAGHRYLASQNIPFVESLTNLDQLPAEGMTFFAFPLRVVGGSGFPVRAFAMPSGAGRTIVDAQLWMLTLVFLGLRLASGILL